MSFLPWRHFRHPLLRILIWGCLDSLLTALFHSPHLSFSRALREKLRKPFRHEWNMELARRVGFVAFLSRGSFRGGWKRNRGCARERFAWSPCGTYVSAHSGKSEAGYVCTPIYGMNCGEDKQWTRRRVPLRGRYATYDVRVLILRARAWVSIFHRSRFKTLF